MINKYLEGSSSITPEYPERKKAMGKYRENIYCIPESIDRKEYILAKYLVQKDTPDFIQYAALMALEGSTGSWIQMPGETPELVARHGAKVVHAFEVPDYEFKKPDGVRTFVVELAFPIVNFGHQIPMLLNTIIGVLSFMAHIKLVDLEFPEAFLRSFPGPQFGIEKMRQYLGVYNRPLCGGIIKPCVGLKPQDAAEIFYKMAVAGVDLVKDDEKMANTSYSSVSDRVNACMAAAARAYEQTGKKIYYAANINDTPDRMLDNARAVQDAGGNLLMLSPLTCGYASLQKIAESADVHLPIMAHPDFVGAVSKSENLGISSHISLGKIPRICGVDISDFATPYGSAPNTREKFLSIHHALHSPMNNILPVWSQVGGAMNPGQVKAVMDDLGNDIILAAGGGVHAHPMGTTAGAKALVQAVDAVSVGRDLRDAAEEFVELKTALDLWGIVGE